MMMMYIKTIEDCMDYERYVMPIYCCYLTSISFDPNKHSIIYFTKPPDFTTTSANRSNYRYRCRDPRIRRVCLTKKFDDADYYDAYPIYDCCTDILSIEDYVHSARTITGGDIEL